MRTVRSRKLLRDALFAGLLFVFSSPLSVVGQGLEGTGNAGIVLEPKFPEPGQTVTASLDAYTLETNGSSITWSLSGVELPEFQNARSITIPVGGLGKKATLSATVRPVNSPAFTLRRDITPTAVDIIVEASTYVPSFYRGRALPVADSLVRVTAIPHISGADPKTLTYRWEQNGSVLFGGPLRGKQSVEVTASRYYGGYLSVSIFNAAGTKVAERNIAFDSVQPELHFYEENPLRGLSEQAILGEISLIGDETTVHGEPYFLNTRAEGGSTKYAWSINGTTANTSGDPHIITLRRTGGSGNAQVQLEAVNDTGIPEFVRGGFRINF